MYVLGELDAYVYVFDYADRQRADREAAARLRDRFFQSLSARGRPALSRDVELPIDGESGKLTKLAEYPMGKNPNWIEIVDLP